MLLAMAFSRTQQPTPETAHQPEACALIAVSAILSLMKRKKQIIVYTDLDGTLLDDETYSSVYPLLQRLKNKGLRPRSLTMDGHRHVIRAIRDIWPQVRLQRCLYHIQREGMRWLRTFPKTRAGKELRCLLSQLHRIKTLKNQRQFLKNFEDWTTQHHGFVKSLPRTTVAFKDLKRAVALIKNARPDMFHYLKDTGIPSTTNLLESFYSRLKADFRRHRGLSETHKKAYLKWYCYFKNQPK